MGEPTIVGRAPPPPPSANAAASYPSPVSPAEQPSSSRPSSPQKKKQVIPPNGALVGRNGRFRLEKTIGQGTYGVVKLASDLVEGNKVAIKIIDKSHITSPRQRSRLEREVSFLKLLHHPHIVPVYDIHETEECIFIAMEYVGGGELFDYIVANKRVKEKEARGFFRQVLSAVDYCHRNHIIHRDLKPENLLLQVIPSPDPATPPTKIIKIIDFGFGNSFKGPGSGHLLDTFCGSPFYAAPEMILGRKYEGPEVDMWSLGVILFALLCGHLPFDDDNMKELYKKIAQGTYTVPDYLMPDARHLISRLITVDPAKRATLQEVLQHRWVNEGYSHPVPDYSPPRPPVKELEAGLVMRMAHLNFGEDEVRRAFQKPGAPLESNSWALNEPYVSLAEADVDDPHGAPVRCTYYLLKEMLAREEQNKRARQNAGLPKVPGAAMEQIRRAAANQQREAQSGPSSPVKDSQRVGAVDAKLPAIGTSGVVAQVATPARTASGRYVATNGGPRRVGQAQTPTSPNPARAAERKDPFAEGTWTTSGASGASQQSAGSATSSQAAIPHDRPATAPPAASSSASRPGRPTSLYIPQPPTTAATTRQVSATVLTVPAPKQRTVSSGSLSPVTKPSIGAATRIPSFSGQSSSSASTQPATIHAHAPSLPRLSVDTSIPSSPSTTSPSSPTKRSGVTSWFVGTSVYQSQRTKEELVSEVTRVLAGFAITHKSPPENDCLFDCEIMEVQLLLDAIKTAKKGELPRPASRPASPTKKFGFASARKKGPELQFSIEISRAPKQASGAYVIHTRRVMGGNWDYRKIAGKVLDALRL